MKLLPSLFALGLAATVLAVSAQGSAVVTTPQVKAELVAHAPEGLVPGRPGWA